MEIFDASVKSLLFSENWSLSFMEEASFFVETHKDCKLWLINDYFGETKNGRMLDMREAVQEI